MIDERRLSAHLDLPLLGAVIALTLVGLATIYSVTYRTNQPGPEFWKQVVEFWRNNRPVETGK